jgi:hypothetical protein
LNKGDFVFFTTRSFSEHFSQPSRKGKKMHAIGHNTVNGIPATEEARLHVLFLCVVRTIVEKHGGTMETDPDTYDAQISIPKGSETVCFHELERLFPGDEPPWFPYEGM